MNVGTIRLMIREAPTEGGRVPDLGSGFSNNSGPCLGALLIGIIVYRGHMLGPPGLWKLPDACKGFCSLLGQSPFEGQVVTEAAQLGLVS